MNNVYSEAEAVLCKTIYENGPGCQCYYTGNMTSSTSQAVQFYSNSNSDLVLFLYYVANKDTIMLIICWL